MSSEILPRSDDALSVAQPDDGLPLKTPTETTLARVLVVDDDPVTRLLVTRALEGAGYSVVGQAEDGEAGIALARETHPDLILMDSSMPGMDGIEATRKIMEESPVAIIMLTAHSEEEHVNQAIDAGACTYLVKPINGARLLPAVRTALDIFQTQYRFTRVA